MVRAREASPAESEYEFDIADAIAGGGGDDGFDFDFSEAGKPVEKKAKKVEKKATAADALELVGDFEGGEDEDDDEAFIAAHQTAINRKSTVGVKGKKAKSGGFQSMGLSANILKAIVAKGFKVPTPIQRKTIPLVIEGRDVVGMARTGSGKTAAFVLPMLEKIKSHRAQTGARAIIMSPSRELALQTLRVVKEFGKGTDLKTVLVVGGDSLEEQFAMMSANPDIIIATPGRFMHLKVEMALQLSSVEYVVFDEADRLFEMGFSSQLTEILHALPSMRQTLLFSATLPKSLVEFAKAGLQDPVLVRLDVDSKISTELESAFFSVKTAEKEGGLLYILQEVIKVPPGAPLAEEVGKKRKRDYIPEGNAAVSPHATIIFVSTKHHVEYISNLLILAGYAVSYIYGSLDQTARKNQIADFRAGRTSLLVVTDVAARGIDIPILSNVINYDFPSEPKVFVHRVGRTARAGRKGWAYSLVRAEDAPYLLDLQLFLGRKLVVPAENKHETPDYSGEIVLGGLPRDGVESTTEFVASSLSRSADLAAQKGVSQRGERLYLKTRTSASAESVKRAKEVVAGRGWSLVHPLLAAAPDNASKEREDMLKRLANIRPAETIFEIGKRGVSRNAAADVMRKRRAKIIIGPRTTQGEEEGGNDDDMEEVQALEEDRGDAWADLSDAAESDVEDAFTSSKDIAKATERKNKAKKDKPTSFKDSEHYISHFQPMAAMQERGYDINSKGTNFAEQARDVAMDLVNDETGVGERNNRGLRWDPKKKNYVNRMNDDDGSKGVKMIRGESGVKIPATFKSGRFEAWQNKTKTNMPGVDSSHLAGQGESRFIGGPRGRFKHTKVQAPKAAVKGRDDYEVRKKRVKEAAEKGLGRGAKKPKTDLKSVSDIRKDRQGQQNRREKNARPQHKFRK
ncbi:hypothetical protein G7K_1072-t1 [Saitoella complicata NRRL Y-17804]|uniref:RNA helicase n=2 Tax=Saitoella complicata (strain BCRC 22490 / CBS 7301 / JCM 7358 / NBRC 10748 / NRRL Y-17804) TaxID=698492 RepID=A0A0E9NAI5_SAICN|nr:hypothetical protein G7K_1072-t1 [Saitoella complicata NRRL Y-17804]